MTRNAGETLGLGAVSSRRTQGVGMTKEKAEAAGRGWAAESLVHHPESLNLTYNMVSVRCARSNPLCGRSSGSPTVDRATGALKCYPFSYTFLFYVKSYPFPFRHYDLKKEKKKNLFRRAYSQGDFFPFLCLENALC